MLPFLRDQNTEKTANSPDTERIGSTASQDAQGQEYFVVAAQNKNVRKSTILLAIFFSVGLLCLGLMIKSSRLQTASASTAGAEETQIEAAITKLTGVSSELFSRMDQIVKKFYEFSNVFQVQVDELTKNPFELEMYLNSISAKAEPLPQNDVDLNADLFRQEQIRQIAKDMQLLTIMQSDNGNCCMINDKLLYEGDLIKGFKVTQIGDKFVKLEWQNLDNDSAASAESHGLEIVLKLAE